MINIKAFERFISDGRIDCSDLYYTREAEDFSPAGAVNVAKINRYAEKREYVFEYDMIA